MTDPNLQPTLAGSVVTLRPMLPADWEGLFAAASDPAVWAGHVKRDRYKEEVFRPFFDGALSSKSALTIVDNTTGRIAGTSRYHAYKTDIQEIEIGWTFLARKYWGGKYNAEIKRLMLEHAFRFVKTVVFWVAEENTISRKAMQNIGGELRDGEFSKMDDGISYPYVVFEIDHQTFLNGPLSNDVS